MGELVLHDPNDFAEARRGKARTESQWRGFDAARTPPGVYSALDEEFGLQVDVAADADNALAPAWFDKAADALVQPWAPMRCWMNPPYSDLAPWTYKAASEAKRGALVVALLPVRTSVAWFHRDVLAAGAEVRFVRGRLSFTVRERRPGGGSDTAPFDSMIVVWRPPPTVTVYVDHPTRQPVWGRPE